MNAGVPAVYLQLRRRSRRTAAPGSSGYTADPSITMLSFDGSVGAFDLTSRQTMLAALREVTGAACRSRLHRPPHLPSYN